jgi:hypothetical protein
MLNRLQDQEKISTKNLVNPVNPVKFSFGPCIDNYDRISKSRLTWRRYLAVSRQQSAIPL